ncbi:UDP-N-acetylmuramoyl-L-alanine--D-glutamate ligase [Candidatus Daviesbacteria bacterium]|nr:UDP-N-acetylmuramoyl-L-alanine--D-glutamate ligase [Candidatus Daviesbacteria bacterium]
MNNFKDKKVLIFGLGLNQGGVGSANFFASQGAKVKVTDFKSKEVLKESIDQLKKYPNIEYSLDGHKNEDIDWADLIIKNPAVKPGNPYIEYALKKGKKMEQDMGIFLDFVKSFQIIGITGTKGKSTTASMIYEILRNHPHGVTLAGNIGKSILDIITMMKAKKNKHLIVLELSSFQLEAFDQHKVSPKYAVITNIYPDHLNYYSSLTEYKDAKRIIGKYQTKDDFLFINRDKTTINNTNFLKGFKGQKNFYSSEDLPKNFNPLLKGNHNKSNMAAALAVGKILGMCEKTILQTLSTFRGIPFRMELIKEWCGFKIYNDSTATNPDATIQALKALGTKNEDEEPNIILICGGMNKGINYTIWCTIVQRNVKKIFFLEGDSTEEMKRLITKKDLVAGTFNDLEKLLTDVKSFVKEGDVILFSPAATSFNLFQNEFDRGRKFNIAVQKVFK